MQLQCVPADESCSDIISVRDIIYFFVAISVEDDWFVAVSIMKILLKFFLQWGWLGVGTALSLYRPVFFM